MKIGVAYEHNLTLTIGNFLFLFQYPIIARYDTSWMPTSFPSKFPFAIFISPYTPELLLVNCFSKLPPSISLPSQRAHTPFSFTYLAHFTGGLLHLWQQINLGHSFVLKQKQGRSAALCACPTSSATI